MKEQNNVQDFPRLGFIGFGEVSFYMMRSLREEGAGELSVLTRCADPSSQERAAALGVMITESWEELFQNADVIFSAVHGNVALETAEKAAGYITDGQYYADLNNAIPTVKQAGAALMRNKRVHFVDVGLLGLPIQRGHKALMYVSGEAAEDFQALMKPFGMNIHPITGDVGQAATVKALANIYMKCLQGVCLELAISAVHAGVSMSDLECLIIDPLKDLPREKDVGFWMIRGALLAQRKREEMGEAMKMLSELQIDPIMLGAAVERLSRVASFDLHNEFDAAMPYEEYEKIIQRMFEIGEEKGIVVS